MLITFDQHTPIRKQQMKMMMMTTIEFAHKLRSTALASTSSNLFEIINTSNDADADADDDDD